MTAPVGPQPVIRYHDGTVEPYDLPHDTRDSRYLVCTQHHRACDCREAEAGEDRQELRAASEESRRYEKWAQAVARLHQRVPNAYVTDYCAQCNTPWPCPTWKLTADVDWLTRAVEKHERGRFDD